MPRVRPSSPCTVASCRVLCGVILRQSSTKSKPSRTYSRHAPGQIGPCNHVAAVVRRIQHDGRQSAQKSLQELAVDDGQNVLPREYYCLCYSPSDCFAASIRQWRASALGRDLLPPTGQRRLSRRGVHGILLSPAPDPEDTQEEHHHD